MSEARKPGMVWNRTREQQREYWKQVEARAAIEAHPNDWRPATPDCIIRPFREKERKSA